MLEIMQRNWNCHARRVWLCNSTASLVSRLWVPWTPSLHSSPCSYVEALIPGAGMIGGGLWKVTRSWGWSPRHGISALKKRQERPAGASLQLRGHSGKAADCNLEIAQHPHQKPTRQTPSSETSQPRRTAGIISAVAAPPQSEPCC